MPMNRPRSGPDQRDQQRQLDLAALGATPPTRTAVSPGTNSPTDAPVSRKARDGIATSYPRERARPVTTGPRAPATLHEAPGVALMGGQVRSSVGYRGTACGRGWRRRGRGGGTVIACSPLRCDARLVAQTRLAPSWLRSAHLWRWETALRGIKRAPAGPRSRPCHSLGPSRG